MESCRGCGVAAGRGVGPLCGCVHRWPGRGETLCTLHDARSRAQGAASATVAVLVVWVTPPGSHLGALTPMRV